MINFKGILAGLLIGTCATFSAANAKDDTSPDCRYDRTGQVISVPCIVREPKGAATLERRWAQLNLQCRGGRGDDPATDIACNQRNVVDRQLEKKGCIYQSDFWDCH